MGRKVAFLISEIKKETAKMDFSKILVDFKPAPAAPKNDLGSLAKDVKKELADKKVAESSSKIDSLNAKKNTGFRIKREKDTQQTIGKFFTASVNKCVTDRNDSEE